VKSEEARFMWLFVFFDLPVGTKTERRNATPVSQFSEGRRVSDAAIFGLRARQSWRRSCG
jgi:CRISPR/Cas system-associated protein endoribonuclease Cas2